MATETDRATPFTGDGVQVVMTYAEGFTVPGYELCTTARQAERIVDEFVDEFTRYACRIEFHHFGYDNRVLGDDGEFIGTDGYPDWIGVYDETAGAVIWERA